MVDAPDSGLAAARSWRFESSPGHSRAGRRRPALLRLGAARGRGLTGDPVACSCIGMHNVAAAVIGASGYTGLELTRILARHPSLRPCALYSDKWSGDSAGDWLPLTGPAAALRYLPLGEAGAAEAELAFLATPAEVSLELAPKLLARGLGGRPLRRVPARGPRALPDLVRLHPRRARAPRRGPATACRSSPARGSPAAARHQPGLLRRPPPRSPSRRSLRAGSSRRRGSSSRAMRASPAPAARRRRTTRFVEIDERPARLPICKHQHVPEIAQTVRRAAGARGRSPSRRTSCRFRAASSPPLPALVGRRARPT